MMPAPPLPHVLTASASPARSAIELVLVGCLTLALTAGYGILWGPTGAMVVAAVLVTVFLVAWLLSSRRRLVVDHGGIEYRGLLGLTRRISVADIESVAYFERFDEGFGRLAPRVIIGRGPGRGPIILDRLFLGAEGPHPVLQALSAAGARVDQYPAPITSPQLAAAFPRHETLRERHPVAVALTVVGVVLAVAVPTVVILVLTRL